MKSRSAVHPLRRARLSLEQLEQREVPAQVNLSLDGNTLKFDTSPNDTDTHSVVISATPGNNFLIQGFNGTTFAIQGQDLGNTLDTSLLGQNFQFPNNATTSVNVKFLGGNDSFEYAGFTFNQAPRLFNEIKIDMGAGNDNVMLRQIFAKNITITNSGVTTNAFDNDTITVAAGGKLDLLGNDNVAETYLGGVSGKLNIGASTGVDKVTVAASVKGDVTVNLAGGDDTFTLRGSSRIGGSVKVTEAATSFLTSTVFTINEDTRIGGSVKFDNAGNDVNATVDGVAMGGDLTIKSGTGSNDSQFFLNNSTVGGTVDVSAGVRHDVFNGAGLVVGKDFKVNLGNGGSSASFTGSRVGGALTLTLGDGDDDVTVNNVFVHGSATLTSGKGVDSLAANTDIINGAFTYTNAGGGNRGANGHDTMTAVTVGGAAILDYGTVGVAFVDVDNSIFHGLLHINVDNDEGRAMLTNSTFGSLIYGGSAGFDSVNVLGSAVLGGLTLDSWKGADANFFVNNTSVGGDVLASAALSTGETFFTLSNGRVTGKVTFNGSPLKDNFTAQNLLVNSDLKVDSKGGAANDTLNNVRVGGSLKFTYAAGNDKLNLLNTTVIKDASIITGGGSDHVDWNVGTVGGKFDLTSHAIDPNNQDHLNGLAVGGNVTATIDAGRLHVDGGVFHKALTFSMAGNKGTNFAGAFVSSTWVQGGLRYTGGTGLDQLDLTNVVVTGNTDVVMGDGADEINILGAGRYTGKATLNLSGPNAGDNDVIRINAGVDQEIVFLGGLQVVTGKGTDTAEFANSAGIVTIFGLNYGEANDAVTSGSNNLFLL